MIQELPLAWPHLTHPGWLQNSRSNWDWWRKSKTKVKLWLLMWQTTPASSLQAEEDLSALSLVQACIHQPVWFDSEGEISGISFILNLSLRGKPFAMTKFPNPTHRGLWTHGEHPEKQFHISHIQRPREQGFNCKELFCLKSLHKHLNLSHFMQEAVAKSVLCLQAQMSTGDALWGLIIFHFLHLSFFILREDKTFSPSSSVPSCTGEVFGCFCAESWLRLLHPH